VRLIFNESADHGFYRVNPSQRIRGDHFPFGVMTPSSRPHVRPIHGAAAAWATTQNAAAARLPCAIGFEWRLPLPFLLRFPRLSQRLPKTGPASELIQQRWDSFCWPQAPIFLAPAGRLVRNTTRTRLLKVTVGRGQVSRGGRRNGLPHDPP